MKKEATIDEVLKQEGGICQIEYDGMIIVAPMEHVKYALRELQKGNKADLMESVNRSLKHSMPRIKSGSATQEEAMAAGQDIAIWYANEILEGRASMQDVKQ